MNKGFRELSGFILIGIGLLGFLIPIMPSVPLIVAGIALVGADNPKLQPILEKIKTIKEKINRSFPTNKKETEVVQHKPD